MSVTTAATTAKPDLPPTEPAEPATEPTEAVPPTDGDEARILDHAYDGIREYDNPLPGWWKAIFYGTIAFAAGYWLYFHVTDLGKTPDFKYRVELSSYEAKRELRAAADARDVSEEILARNAQDPQLLEHGAAIFASRCASCHAEDGRGLIGPNLTDSFQLHGATRMDIFKTVQGGVAGTPMVAWGEQMPPTDTVAVTTFVTTLRGKNIKGKEPQGQPVEPFK
jgi:cytochrome c oxidase cbb3-type subunit 3